MLSFEKTFSESVCSGRDGHTSHPPPLPLLTLMWTLAPTLFYLIIAVPNNNSTIEQPQASLVDDIGKLFYDIGKVIIDGEQHTSVRYD